MRESHLEAEPKNKAETVLAITIIKQECQNLGANDYEIPALDELIRAVENVEIGSDEAISQAQYIKDSKMDYH